ncbi:hypothetical protein TrLO_g2858 [Triparma laevis f. longispina]|uniref:UBX domain-containing protein n=1 Tax=Triparma laevis f. longispina TaxID=1714387 RepID=A0A9W7CI27_9STRA|nr:hypothetical protein TrLO_g2858 [Triparma laevis f. longispina]
MPKKLCPKGLDCPFMNEGQHTSEFRHEDEKAKQKKKDVEAVWKSKGNKTGGGGSGSGSGGGGGARRGKGVSRLLDAPPAPPPKRPRPAPKSTEEVIEILSSDDDDDDDEIMVVEPPRKKSQTNGNENFNRDVVDLCSPTSEQPKAKRREKPKPKPAKPKLPQRARPPAQPRPTFVDEEKQMQSAISQSNKIVKDGQDSEYFESLKKDKAKEQQKREEELQKEEEKLIENTVEESAKSLEVEVRSKLERMKEVLKHKIPPVDAEDTDDTIITLLIKLPRSFASTSVTRKFYKANLAEDVLEFIRADEKEKKEGGELHLCTVFPVRKVGEEETIESLGLGKRGTVVVREP